MQILFRAPRHGTKPTRPKSAGMLALSRFPGRLIKGIAGAKSLGQKNNENLRREHPAHLSGSHARPPTQPHTGHPPAAACAATGPPDRPRRADRPAGSLPDVGPENLLGSDWKTSWRNLHLVFRHGLSHRCAPRQRPNRAFGRPRVQRNWVAGCPLWGGPGFWFAFWAGAAHRA